MPDSPDDAAKTRPPSTFAQWLDVLVPKVFKNDSALARAIGVHRSAVVRWRRGANPGVATIHDLAKATGVSEQYILQICSGRVSWDDEDGWPRT